MDEHTPIDVPIRLEEWDRHDYINEVDTIVVDIRPILDATARLWNGGQEAQRCAKRLEDRLNAA